MPELPPPYKFFNLGIRVAFHVCGREFSPRGLLETSHVLEDILRGNLTLEDSPAEIRNDIALGIERLRHQDDGESKKALASMAEFHGLRRPGQSDDEAAKGLLDRVDRDGIEKFLDAENEEGNYRRRVAQDQSLAKCIMKSEIEDWNVPKEWVKAWGLDKFLE
jgi:hypothetical protein